MQFQDRFSSSSSFNLKALLSFKDISPKTQAHLTQVYTTIMACVLVCATGMYVNSSFLLQGFLWNLLSIISMVYLMYKISSPYLEKETKLMYLAGLAF